jgi:hypothetical protein
MRVVTTASLWVGGTTNTVNPTLHAIETKAAREAGIKKW